MLYSYCATLIKVFILLFLYLATGCRLDSEEVSTAYNSYQFDLKVIEKLPVYDSLASAILEKLPFFQQHMNANESYRAYKYRPRSDQDDAFRKIPPELSSRIDRYYTRLGDNFIYGFDVFKDSTIKICVRSQPSGKSGVTIEENLSYYPLKNTIRRREFPVKDTMLNAHWQYWTRFNKQDLF